MNKQEFVDQVAEKAGMTRAAAARAVDAIFDTASGAVSQAVHTAGELSIPGFGKFTKKTRAARQGRNPRTGDVIDIPERSTIAFSAGKNFREGTPSGRRKAAGAVAGAALGAAAGVAAAAATARKPRASAKVETGTASSGSSGDTSKGRSGGAKSSGGGKSTGNSSGNSSGGSKSGGSKGGGGR